MTIDVRRISVLGVVVAFASFGLIGCSDDAPISSTPTEEPTEEPTMAEVTPGEDDRIEIVDTEWTKLPGGDEIAVSVTVKNTSSSLIAGVIDVDFEFADADGVDLWGTLETADEPGWRAYFLQPGQVSVLAHVGKLVSVQDEDYTSDVAEVVANVYDSEDGIGSDNGAQGWFDPSDPVVSEYLCKPFVGNVRLMGDSGGPEISFDVDGSSCIEDYIGYYRVIIRDAAGKLISATVFSAPFSADHSYRYEQYLPEDHADLQVEVYVDYALETE